MNMRKICSVCVISALLMPVFAADVSIRQILDSAGKAINAKKYDEALELCEQGLTAARGDSDKVNLILKKSDAFVRSGRHKEALDDLMKLSDRLKGKPSYRVRILSSALNICNRNNGRFKKIKEGIYAELIADYRSAYETAQIPASGKGADISRARMTKVRYLIDMADKMIGANESREKICAVYKEAQECTLGDVDTKLAALNAEVRYHLRRKDGETAYNKAKSALDVAQADPEGNRLREAGLSVARALYSLKRYEESSEAFLTAVENSNAKTVSFPSEGYEAIIWVTRIGKPEKALEYLRRLRAVPRMNYSNIARTWEFEARTYNAQGKVGETKKLFERIFSDSEFLERGNVAEMVVTAAKLHKNLEPHGFKGIFDFYDKVLADPERYNLSGGALQKVLNAYGSQAQRSMDPARMDYIWNLAKKLGMPFPEDCALGWMRRHYEELEAFPLDEKDIKIPMSIADFGVDANRKIVHAKDFGWNPTNATDCLQKALDSDASTVIVDDMGSPWYIWSVELRSDTCSNRKIIFKKGVKVLSAPEHRRKDEPGWYRKTMFHFNGCTNLWIEGEGELKDVYIGKYRNRKERFKAGFQYGGHGFGGSCRNTVIKNLHVANCGQDALAWGGKNSFVIDCLFDDNYRQGLSVGASHNCVYKNVTFCNTFGGEPHSGVDFEPYYELYSCPNHYFYDCKFYNNACFNVLFATSTFAPTTAHFKRCQFEASPNGNIGILARPGVYMQAFKRAPSKIVFEDCRMDGYSDGNVIKFLSTFLFDVTFKNCVVNDKGLFRKRNKPNQSPILLNLDRKVYDGFYPNAGIVTFENFVINGYENVPIVGVCDRNGHYGINTFRGVITHNGRKVDMSTFSYLPPDRNLSESSEPELKTLYEPEGRAAAWKHEFDMGFGHTYYNPLPQYNVFVSGKKGDKVEMTVRYYSKIQKDPIEVVAPSGKKIELMIPKTGVNSFSFVLPEDGSHLLNLNVKSDLKDEELSREGFSILSAKGASLSYQARNLKLGRVVYIKTGDSFADYTGYFEVPPGEGNVFKLLSGGVEIRDAEGDIVYRYEPSDYVGTKCLQLKTSGSGAEIWSFKTIGRGGASFKFYAPLPGIWSDDPETLPTVNGKNLPFKRLKRATSSVSEMPKAKLFPLPLKGTVALRVKDAALKRLEFGKGKEWIVRYRESKAHYNWSEPAAQTKEQLKAAKAELESIEPLRKMSDMQVAAGRESEDLREYVAFVSLYAHILALDDAEAKAWAESMEEPEDDDFLEKVNGVVSSYGIEFTDDGMYYEDYTGIVKIAPFIVERMKKLGVDR